ncbi:uncharacterized protein [Heterodontus francisci]|uniref:uncharacterized protein n=1 Tax=Heterodontus francisci TaxID=7792 RepID=UPI00355BCD66
MFVGHPLTWVFIPQRVFQPQQSGRFKLKPQPIAKGQCRRQGRDDVDGLPRGGGVRTAASHSLVIGCRLPARAGRVPGCGDDAELAAAAAASYPAARQRSGSGGVGGREAAHQMRSVQIPDSGAPVRTGQDQTFQRSVGARGSAGQWEAQEKDKIQYIGTSETMNTLKNLVNKGVKVELGIPVEMWDEPSAEVTDLKKQCENMLEKYEEVVEDWYFQHQDLDLERFLCMSHVLTKDDQDCLTEVWKGRKGASADSEEKRRKKTKEEEKTRKDDELSEGDEAESEEGEMAAPEAVHHDAAEL